MKSHAIILSLFAIVCSSYSWATDIKASEINKDYLGLPKNQVSFAGGTLDMDADIGLGSKTLILKGVSGITGSGHFTGSAGSVLEIVFADGKVELGQNSNFFTGDLKLIVGGSDEKEIRLPKKSTHTGGTKICGGIVDGTTGSTKNLSDNCLPFGAKESILEIVGGTVLIHAYYNMGDYYPIVMSGGCLKNDKEYSGSNNFNAKITVEADSTIDADFVIPFCPNEISGTGKLTLTGAGGFVIKKDILMAETSLAVAAPFNLGAYKLEVNDYEVTAASAPTGTGEITVNGVFKPTTDNYCEVILKNDAAIDLSAKTEPWTGTKVGFAENATIKIKVGERMVAADDYILKWADDADYAGRKFLLDGTNTSGLVLEADATGLKVAAETDEVASAVWTGAADDDFSNPANWECKNAADKVIEGAVPTATTPVTFRDLSKISFAEQLPFASVTFDGAFLGADTTWSSLEYVPNDLVLDLKGKKLALPNLTTTTCAATITDTVGGGVVEMEVLDGSTFRNETLNFAGKVKIVKKGLGTFVAVKNEMNEGGFEVVAGEVTLANEKLPLWTKEGRVTTYSYPFGKGVITLDENASLNPLGGYNWTHYTINLNGGKIENTVKSTGLSGNATAASISNCVFDATINLQANSTIKLSEDFNFFGKLVSAGDFELTVDIADDKYFTWCPTEAKNLKLTTKGGWFRTTKYPLSYEMQENLDFTCYSALCLLGGSDTNPGGMAVRNYTSRYEKDGSNSGGAALSVYGVFTPDTDYFRGCQMMDGSSILLPESGVWEIKSKSSSESGTPNTLSFADNATIKIDLSRRTSITSGNRVLGWSAKPNNLNGLTFVAVADNKEILAKYMLTVVDNGISMYHRLPLNVPLWTDNGLQEKFKKFGKKADDYKFTASNLSDITTTLNTQAVNGYTLAENLTLGLEQADDGEFGKQPFLAADTSAKAEKGKIVLAICGLNDPLLDQNIQYKILETTSVDGGEWVVGQCGLLTDKDMSTEVALPEVTENGSAVKYFKVQFSVEEGAN